MEPMTQRKAPNLKDAPVSNKETIENSNTDSGVSSGGKSNATSMEDY